MNIKTGLEYIGAIDPWTDEERLFDEEIVRCRDCKYIETCDMHYQMEMETGRSADDGFCAWGERIEND